MTRGPEAIVELRRSLGARLATFRLAAELTQGRLAKVAFCDRTTVVHIEKGRARADERFWRAVDAACAAEGALVAAYLELESAKNEHLQREREQRLADVRAKADEFRDRSGSAGNAYGAPPDEMPSLAELRRSLLGHEPDHEPPAAVHPAQLHNSVMEAHRLYQQADYDSAARLLPSIINRLESSAGPTATKAAAYVAVAKLATKVGDPALAWVAADRSLRLARETDRPGLIGVANYQVACALLASGHRADAEAVAAQASEQLARAAVRSNVEDVVSARGALLLLLAIMAGLRSDSEAAQQNLRAAAHLAEHLEQDGNWLWTGFGPTNVAIHELTVHVTLGDSRAALRRGESIAVDALPAVLRGRRSQVHLELGRASAACSRA